MHRLLSLLGLALAAPAFAAPADLIRELPTGTDWADGVERLMLSLYDIDGNGTIQTSEELRAIDCGVWEALDGAVRSQWGGSSVRVIYGFDAGYHWVGYAFGFDESLRGAIAGAMDTCGVLGSFSTTDMPTSSVAAPASGATRLMISDTGGKSKKSKKSKGGAEAERSIAAVPPDAEDWSSRVRTILLASFDADRSGEIDSTGEIARVGCGVWRAMDASVTEKWGGTSLRVIYGFQADYIWVGDAFGIAEPLRSHLDQAVVACGVGTESGGSSSPVTLASALTNLYEGASWAEDAKRAIVGAVDGNGNGTVDAGAETRAIPCDAWFELDRHVRDTYTGATLRQFYGFQKGYVWLGGQLGFAESARAAADKAAAACGLR